ncbi:MAG: histidine kinase N-terminal 7TM domain-containing protein, partial [Candidatus Saccharibacteria bacterium]
MIAFMLILAASGSVVLGILVLSRGWRFPLNILAASINACVAIWSLGILLFLQTSDPTVALVSAKGYYIASALFVALLTIFSTVFPAGQRPLRKYTILVALIAVAMFLLLLVPSFVTTHIILKPGGHNFIRVEPLSYVAFCTYFVIFFSAGFTIMVRKFYAFKHKARAQAGSFLFGLVAMSAPGFITNLYLPFFGVYDYIWVGP